MISKRLSDIFCNEKHFDSAASIYYEALKNCGFNETLKSLELFQNVFANY